MPSLLSNTSTYGIGTMSYTWKPEPLPKDQVFAALNAAIDSNKPEQTFVNGGEFYGADYLNLKYLQEFFEKYPEQRQHAVISIKGGINSKTHVPYTTKQEILGSIDTIVQFLPGLEIFEPARLHPEGDLSEVVSALDEAIDTGRIKGFSLSEVNAETLSKVAKLTKYQVDGIEIEFSLFTRDIITNGIAKTAGELNIPIIAYSPLSRGFLTGEIKKKSDIPEGDLRHLFGRFSEESIKTNVEIVEGLKTIAEKKNATLAQLALAWVHYHSEKKIDGLQFPKVIPIPSSSSVARVKENFARVVLTDDEYKQIAEYINGKKVSGLRYYSNANPYLAFD